MHLRRRPLGMGATIFRAESTFHTVTIERGTSQMTIGTSHINRGHHRHQSQCIQRGRENCLRHRSMVGLHATTITSSRHTDFGRRPATACLATWKEQAAGSLRNWHGTMCTVEHSSMLCLVARASTDNSSSNMKIASSSRLRRHGPHLVVNPKLDRLLRLMKNGTPYYSDVTLFLFLFHSS